jgi:nicotinate-nucleotide pyrophosphorylase (carboxylating)
VSIGSQTSQWLEPIGWDLELVEQHVRRTLDEDLAYGPDVTSLATVPAGERVVAEFAARHPGVTCGIGLVALTLDQVIGTDGWSCRSNRDDGTRVVAGDVVLSLEAPAQGLLTAERTALNYLCHLSGVATLTAAWVDAIAGSSTVVRDTRKTLPGLRVLEKYAVRCGGGSNHRMGLGDAALIKDNHIAAAGGVAAAVAAVRQRDAHIGLEVECDTVEQVIEAVDAAADLVLLDNMSLADLRRSVAVVRERDAAVRLEASGGLSLASAPEVAATGVDFVSIGALTHSAPVLDLGLDVVEVLDRVDR